MTQHNLANSVRYNTISQNCKMFQRAGLFVIFSLFLSMMTLFLAGVLFRREEHNIRPVSDLVTHSTMPVNVKIMMTSGYYDLDLYVRMTTRSPQIPFFYDKILVQSMKYFWPANVSLVLVLDGEHKPDHGFGNTAKNKFPYPKICYMDKEKDKGYSGKDRMQRDMFYPERCTSKKYVGYVDTDAMFVTRVIPEILFDGYKPVVLGVYGSLVTGMYNVWAKTTMNLFKTKEIMRCMSYFPVIVKVEHIILLRKYLEKLHNSTFDKILPLHKTFSYQYSQFHLMCQYIWLFHRDEYTFHFQFNPKKRPVLSPNIESSDYYSISLTPYQKAPFPRASIHYKYYTYWKKEATYRNVLKAGVCFSGGFSLCPEKCKKLKHDSLQKELFKFEFHTDWTWDSRCYQAQINHYKLVHKRADEQYSKVIQNACSEVDNLIWKH